MVHKFGKTGLINNKIYLEFNLLSTLITKIQTIINLMHKIIIKCTIKQLCVPNTSKVNTYLSTKSTINICFSNKSSKKYLFCQISQTKNIYFDKYKSKQKYIKLKLLTLLRTAPTSVSIQSV